MEKKDTNLYKISTTHRSKLEKVLNEIVTPQFQNFPFIYTLVMSKKVTWLDSVGIQDQKAKNKSKMGRKTLKFAYFDLVLPLEIWMPTEFGHLANFDFSNVYMNGKCLTWVVKISLRTIFNLEQFAFDSLLLLNLLGGQSA